MGFSLKKIAKTVSNVVSHPGDALEKVAKTAAAAGIGFVTAGPVGAVAAGGREAIRQSKTGEGAAFTVRSAYQGAATALVAGVASVGVSKLGSAVASKGGFTGIAKGAFSKAVAAGKSGGLVKGVLGAAKKAVPFAAGLLKKAPQTLADGSRIDAATEVVESSDYGKSVMNDVARTAGDMANSVRATGMGRLKTTLQGFANQVPGSLGLSSSPAPVNVTVDGPQQAGMSAGFGEVPWVPIIMVAAAYLFSKKKK